MLLSLESILCFIRSWRNLFPQVSIVTQNFFLTPSPTKANTTTWRVISNHLGFLIENWIAPLSRSTKTRLPKTLVIKKKLGRRWGPSSVSLYKINFLFMFRFSCSLQTRSYCFIDVLEGDFQAGAKFGCGIISGILASGVTQPADVIKTKMQLYPSIYPNVSAVLLHLHEVCIFIWHESFCIYFTI